MSDFTRTLQWSADGIHWTESNPGWPYGYRREKLVGHGLTSYRYHYGTPNLSSLPKENPMKKPFDPTKPVQTRDGRKARIIATNKSGGQPIVALVEDHFAGLVKQIKESIEVFNADGTYALFGSHAANDLVNIPVKRVVWVNIYERTGYGCHFETRGCHFETREKADECAGGQTRLACVRLEFEEGEGL